VAETATPPALSFLWDWFRETAIGLRLRESQLVSANFAPSDLERHLVGLTHEELKNLFKRYLRELDEVASLTMIASTEAMLRLDFEQRVSKRRKDKVSREFRDIKRRRGARVRLNEDILEAWSAAGGAPRATIGDFRRLLNLRDWLAHGRYWIPRIGQQYDARGVFAVTSRLLERLRIPQPT